MCFSPEGDLIGGLVVTAIGVDACLHLKGRPEYRLIAPFPILNSTWVEYGGRLGYRFSRNLVVDAFAIGTLGGEVGRTLHVGLGARYAF